MKVYRISKWAFGSICLLILLLPVSRHWKLLTTGERTTGTVTGYNYRIWEDEKGEGYPVKASEIEFEVDARVYKTYGPDNYAYKQGRSLTIYYHPEDPAKNCVATFSGFYLNYYTAVPLVLLIIWYAFYLSFNNYRKRMKMPKIKGGTGSSTSSPKAFQDPGRRSIK